jgi:meiosis-specific transcription factor NDT80
MPQDHQNGTGEGPPFHDTKVQHSILTSRGQRLTPELVASIQKGFFQVDRKWTCYRRNYFAVQCSFNFRQAVVENQFFLHRNGGSEELIHSFAVSISAKTALTNNGESETRGLVQHTPKRDKATESIPGRHQIQPAFNHGMAGSGGFAPGAQMFPGAPHPHHLHAAMLGNFGTYDGPGPGAIPSSHTFERIQFQKATANNGKRRAQQQYFQVVVELSANVGRDGNDNWILIATKESDPMVVRGRSPGHYKDGARRDSQASDGDYGSGNGSSSYSGSVAPYSTQGTGHSRMDWIGGSSNGHYHGSHHRHSTNPCYSPSSMESTSTLADALTEAELNLSEVHTVKSSRTLSTDSSALTPLSEDSDEIMFGSLDRDSGSRKRPFEDEAEEEQLRFSLSGPFTDSISSINNFSTHPYSKLLCAS